MATIEMVHGLGRWVFEVDAGHGMWVGPVQTSTDDGRGCDCVCACLGARLGAEYGERVGSSYMTPISGYYPPDTFADCRTEADWCRILAESEGLTAMLVNGSTVWSAAADAEAEALSGGWTG